MDYKEINDNELLYLISDNNDEYKDVLFEKYKPIVLALAKKYSTINKDIAIDTDDLVQTGYIGLNNAIRFYKSDHCLFYTYACFCIEHALKKEVYKRKYRKGKNHYSFISYEDHKNLFCYIQESEMTNMHFLDLFVQAKNALDFIDSLIFELRLNGFKYKEISMLLDIKESKVDYSIQKARRKLKKFL